MYPLDIHRFLELISDSGQSVIKSISRISWSGRASVQSQAMTSCLASSNLTGATPHHPSSDSRHHHNDVMKIIDMYISLYHTGIRDVFNYLLLVRNIKFRTKSKNDAYKKIYFIFKCVTDRVSVPCTTVCTHCCTIISKIYDRLHRKKSAVTISRLQSVFLTAKEES